jgi:hypothetical protein
MFPLKVQGKKSKVCICQTIMTKLVTIFSNAAERPYIFPESVLRLAAQNLRHRARVILGHILHLASPSSFSLFVRALNAARRQIGTEDQKLSPVAA